MWTPITFQKSKTRVILETGLLAGVLDGLGASIHFIVATHKNPGIVFQYVASAVMGRDIAFAGGTAMVLTGILFHLIIAMGWTVVLFMVYPTVYRFIKNKWLLGALYGIFVWTMMTFLIVPLTRAQSGPVKFPDAIIGASIIIVAIGLPTAWFAHRFYFKNPD